MIEVTEPYVAGWVSDPGDGPPTVELFLDGAPLVSVKADMPRPDVRRSLGYEGSAFIFRPSPALLAQIPRGAVLSGEVQGRALVLGPGAVPKIGKAPLGDTTLADMLARGGAVSAKSGSAYTPIGVIEGWRDKMVGLYEEVRSFFRAEFGLDLYIFYGTLLGLVREGGFIARDDDFDSAFILEANDLDSVAARFVAVGDALRRAGWDVEIFPSGNMHVRRAAGAAPLDVFVAARVEDRLLSYEVNAPIQAGQLMPATLSALDHEFTVPSDPDAVLTAIYGADWRTPDPAFQWRRSPETAQSMRKLEEAIRSELALRR